MEQKTIKKIEVIPFALTIGLIEAVLGLIVGIIEALFIGAMMSLAPYYAGPSAMMARGIGVLAIVAYPVAFFILGFIGSAIIAIIYNFIVPHVGGIKVEVE
ncbi:MAG: hypothetical protein ABOK23_09925 [Candidatus Methanoperedens sp.]|jgi:hypothetical protein|nr:hypothetical protein [Candidatus Methanoperedens sp.]MCZ7396749.1 hypothetical protein [Candidatus Methanoperedens sp.]